MTAVLFDTQKFVEQLEAAKFPPEQAKAQSEAMREALETAFASHAKKQQDISTRAVESLDSKTEKALVSLKHDVNERFAKTDAKIDKLEAKLDAKIDKLEAKLDAKIDKLEAKLDTRLAEVKGELILLRWMIGAVFAGIVTLLIRTFTA